MTKSGKNMMFATLEDLYGSVELVLFPNVFEKYENILQDDTVVKVTGKVSIKEDEKSKILVSNMEKIENAPKKEQPKEIIITKIYIRIPKDKFDLEDKVIGYIKDLSKEYPGDSEVYIFYDGTNKMRILNKNNFLSDISIVEDRLGKAFGKENVKIKKIKEVRQ